ncbi:hypothetical protein K2173_004574 [Erythroxylum novogranatense]|uniref:Ribosomal protein S15 n=1 Tax=Erythroxylum novogranatense TaxID=1862640 RepID=A0AAV8T5X7_9ROSI|nr:hypothetical protein K2173_004574 [Erythroxylum novogranatense]
MAQVTRCYDYSKLDSEDPDESIHRRAQFLIYKTLKAADSRRGPWFLRIKLCRLKIRVGRKLRKLRKRLFINISAARVRIMYKQVTTQWKRLIGNGEFIAGLPAILP